MVEETLPNLSIEEEFHHLEVKNLAKSFGGVKAVQDVSFYVKRGEIVGLIGPNGAGKTTLFNMITGLEKPDAGHVYFSRNFITNTPAHKIVKLGMARTFQNIRLLEELTVIDNIKIAYHHHFNYNFVHAMFRLPKFFKKEKVIRQKSMRFLEYLQLESHADDLAGSLPYGKRRLLEIARALATEGTMLLLDEPAAGMNPHETNELLDIIRKINKEFRLSILLIEHDMKLVMSICDRIVVVEHGKMIAQGTPDQIRENPKVIEAYLGTGHEDKNL